MMTDMKTFFVRHTRVLPVSDATVASLFSDQRIALHYPGAGPTDSESRDPTSYTARGDQVAIRALVELAQVGGYVWAEYRTTGVAYIGKVLPGSEIELRRSEWVRRDPGREAVLKTLQLKNVRKVLPNELLALRATRPRQGTIARWRKAGRTVEKLVERQPLSFSLQLLSPGQLETMCAEFLRSARPGYPTLDALLMPVGRTMKDLDFYGLSDSGRRVLAQVTFHRADSDRGRRKLEALAEYAGSNVELLLFCECQEMGESGGVRLVPLQQVEDWLSHRSELVEALMPALSD